MKFTLATAISLLAIACISTVTGQDPVFIKTLAQPFNFKNVPESFHGYSRCERAVNSKRPSLAVVQKIAGPQFNCSQHSSSNEHLCTPPSTLSTPSAPLATASTQAIFKSDANMGQVEFVEELTLRTQCDPVGLAPPFNTKFLTIKSASDSYHSSQWQVVMTRVNSGGCDSKLDIQLRSPSSYSRLLATTFWSVNIVYHQRHLASVPLSESAFISFPVKKAHNGSRYEFDIILSTQPQLAESPKMAPLLSSSSPPSEYTKSKSSSTNLSSPSPLSRCLIQSQVMMKMFLRDRPSVDV
ncbi:MAG: hypothetical protein J3R72DRAFT_520653 [Linnemannia gamsii]|nr:MAG: hypothetical protein J3R72DRAFT_520653 [Linnemannia gamsii]